MLFNSLYNVVRNKNVALSVVALMLASCATQSNKTNSHDKTNVLAHKDGFPSESVREAYLRLKKPEWSEEDKRIELNKSSEIAKASSRSMIEGASNIDLKNSKKYYVLEGAEELNLETYHFDFPVVYNAQVKKWLNYFLNRGRPYFQRYTERAGRYAPILGTILEEHGLPRDLIFLAMAESGFNNVARSWAAAVGPWQFMPYTGKIYGLEQDWYRDERRDPIKATVSAARYLSKLYDDFGSWEVAAAAYNAGEGKLGRAIKKYKTEDFWKMSKGHYLKDETKNYVPKIMALAIIGKNLKSFGFEDIEFHETLDFDEVIVKPSTDLVLLSEKMGVEFEEVQRLNPEILRWFTPPNIAEYRLRLPAGSVPKYLECCYKEDLVATNYQEFTVPKNGMSMASLAQKHRIRDAKVLAELNDVSTKAWFKGGTTVKLPFRQGEAVNEKNNLYADLYHKPRREVLRRKKAQAYAMARTKSKRTVASHKRNGGKTYKVRRGDTLFSIARKHGITVKRLVSSNKGVINTKTKDLYAGVELIIR